MARLLVETSSLKHREQGCERFDTPATMSATNVACSQYRVSQLFIKKRRPAAREELSPAQQVTEHDAHPRNRSRDSTKKPCKDSDLEDYRNY